MTTTSLPIADTQTLVLDNAADMAGYAMLICQTASDAGLFLTTGRNKTLITAARKAAKSWLKEVRRNIDRLSPADALTVVSHYESVYKVAYATEFGAVESEFVSRYVLRAFEARIRQDHAVNPYELFRQITHGLNRRDRIYFGRPLQWHADRLDRWHREITTGAARLSSGDIADTAQKLSILLQTDLWAYEPGDQTAFKQTLFNRYRHLLDEYRNQPLEELLSLQTLLISSQRYLTRDAFEVHRRTLLEALISNPSTNRYHRAALTLRQHPLWQ